MGSLEVTLDSWVHTRVAWTLAKRSLLASIVNSSKMNAEAEVNRFGLFMNCIQARVSFKNASKFNNGWLEVFWDVHLKASLSSRSSLENILHQLFSPLALFYFLRATLSLQPPDSNNTLRGTSLTQETKTTSAFTWVFLLILSIFTHFLFLIQAPVKPRFTKAECFTDTDDLWELIWMPTSQNHHNTKIKNTVSLIFLPPALCKKITWQRFEMRKMDWWLKRKFPKLMWLPFASPLTLAFLSFPVLFASVLVFTVTSLWILSDKRRQLITAIRLYHPSFLYAYLALPIQSGVVQVSKGKNKL